MVLTKICLFKDFQIFVKIASKGAISVIALMTFIISVGAYSLTNTNFKFTLFQDVKFEQKAKFDLVENYSREIPLLNSNPAPLSGVLAIGYFMHPFIIPVLRGPSIS